MRILVLTVELPYLTAAGGGNLRQHHLIRHLSRRHEIWLVSAALPWEMERAREVEPFCRRLEVVPHHFRFRPARRRWHYWLNRLSYLRSPFPFEVERYHHLIPAFRAKAEALLREWTPDLVQVEQSSIAHWRSLVPPEVPGVLVMYDVLTEVARLKPAGTRREAVLNGLELMKTRRYERRNLPVYDRLVTVSEEDRSLALELAPRADVEVVPNGVDISYFSPSRDGESDQSLVFTGSLGHPPNEDGVLWFCREVLPRIRARRPEVRFQIVGRSPSSAMRSLDGRNGVVVVGEVPDVCPYLGEASVVVAPLRYGGGTRLKILEAMASGKAVVSTRIGAAGLEVSDGEQLLLADEPKSFAEAVLDLMGDPNRRAAMGTRGRDLVERRYDWGILADRMDRIYADVLGKARRASGE